MLQVFLHLYFTILGKLDILGLYKMLWEAVGVFKLKTDQHSVKTQVGSAFIP